MKARTLNRHLPKLDESRKLARLEAQLREAYEDVLDFAAREAARRFQTAATHESLAASTPGVTGSSTMVAVYPTPEQAAMLAQAGGEEPDVLHCTLAFLGELDPDQAEAALAAMRSVADQHGVLEGSVGGVASFGDNGNGHPSILLPDVDGLAELRHAVCAAIDEAGIERATNHGWTPHITLSYEDEPKTPAPSLIGYPLTFDQLSVSRGNVRRDLDLRGGLAAAASSPGTSEPSSEAVAIAEAEAELAAGKTVTLEEALTAGAVVATSETGKLVGEVAAKYGPDSAPDYGDCWWNEETGTVYWITADYTSNEALEAAPADFLAIDGVESVEDCDECGAPEGDGWEFVYDNTGTESVVAAGPPDWTQPHPDELVDVDALVARFSKKADPVRKDAVAAVATPALAGAGISYDATNPLISSVYGRVGQHITFIAETTRLNAMRIVRRSYEEGLSIPDTAAALREGMASASVTRSTLIARTEMTSLVNGAALAVGRIVDEALTEARDDGEEDVQDFAGYHKRWLTAPGAHFPRHEDYDGLDGQTVPLDAPFDVGGVPLMYPGDPDGPPEEVCNCRCTIVLVDASGADAEEDPGDVGLEAAAEPPLPFSDDEGGTDVRDRAKQDDTGEALESATTDLAADEETLSEEAAAPPMASDECAECGHLAENHAGDDMMGQCEAEGCDCSSFVPEGEEPPDELTSSGNGMSVSVRIRPDMTEAREAIAEGVASAIQDGLSRVTFTTNSTADGGTSANGGSTFDVAAPVLDVRPAPGPDSVEVAPPEQELRTSANQQWFANLAPEGKITDDGRVFAPGSISWRELPLSLMAMTETPGEGGHAGAELAGRIDRIWRDDSTPLPHWINGEGEFDTGDYGEEIARLVGEQTLRGNSVDLAIHRVEFGPRDLFVDENGIWRDDAPAEGELPEPTLDDLFSDDLIMIVRAAVIGMSTVCPFPAFADANIVLASGEVGETRFALEQADGKMRWRLFVENGIHVEDVLTASAEGMAPLKPPAEWFENPELEELTPLTVDDDGRVYGHAWAWESCHIGIPGTCVTAPHSRTDYSYFHLKEVECEDGSVVAVGSITLGTGHADQRASRQAATEHYDHTGTVVADVRVYEDEFGGCVAGALRPDVPAGRVREFRGSTPSGDWRKVNGNLELVGLLAVNVPGFPVPRTKALVASADEGEPDVLTLVAAGLLERPAGTGEIEFLDPSERAKLRAVAARATGGLQALAALAASRPTRTKPPAPALVAAPVWDSENGLMDVMGDIASILNPGDSYRYWVVDVAIGGESAIVCDADENAYYLVPLTYADGEPVVPPMSEWTEVESEWVQAEAASAYAAFAKRRLHDLASRVA